VLAQWLGVVGNAASRTSDYNSHDGLKVVKAYVDLSLAQAQPDQKFKLERLGYFVADHQDLVAGTKPVFDRVTG
jgi:hypothetical protein